MSREIAHLHTHTKYSEKDGSALAEDYVKKISEYNKLGLGKISALAVTDHGNMFSFVKHWQACQEAKIKAIIGCEVYHTEDRSVDHKKIRHHMVLLAKDNTGLKNLFQLVTDAGTHKEKGKAKDFPKSEERAFQKWGKGIIGLSACIGGIIPQLILEGKYDEAKEKASLYASYFEEFYLEVQPHELPEQLLVNADLVRISKETGIPLVMTCDAHYVDKTDKPYNDILHQIGHMNPFTVECHLRTPEEYETYCIDNGIPLEAIDNSVKIANSITADPTPTDAMGLLPKFPCPVGYTEDSYLRKLTMDYLLEAIPKKRITNPDDYISKSIYELDIICSAGFAGYFLILWDWFLWCRKNDILTGKGRGSAAGSVVSYLLSITTVDPIKNKFIFERFMNPERIEFPDYLTIVELHSNVWC